MKTALGIKTVALLTETTLPTSDKDIKAIIDVNAIRNNVNFLKKKTGLDLMPVLKADAYGHGLIEMAKILRKL